MGLQNWVSYCFIADCRCEKVLEGQGLNFSEGCGGILSLRVFSYYNSTRFCPTFFASAGVEVDLHLLKIYSAAVEGGRESPLECGRQSNRPYDGFWGDLVNGGEFWRSAGGSHGVGEINGLGSYYALEGGNSGF